MRAVLISFVSAKGSPGVTTAVLALASQWPRTAVVVDADPAGGDIAAGLGRGTWPAGANLAELVVDSRTSSADVALRRRAVRFDAHCPFVLAGLGAPGQAPAVPWARLGAEFAHITDADILIDCGRLSPVDETATLLRCSDQILVVTGSSLRAVRSSSRLVELVDHAAGHPEVLGLLVVAPDAPYSTKEITQACRLPVAGTLPDDPRAARVWSDGDRPGRWFGRSALQREARHTAAAIASTTQDTMSAEPIR